MKTAILTAILTAAAFAQDINSISSTASGSITAANADCTIGAACTWISMPLNPATATVQISGTFTATLQFEASTTGTVWSAITSTGGASSATAAGTFTFSMAGQRYLRVRASAYTSGTVVVGIASSSYGGNGGGAAGSSNGWSYDAGAGTITAAAGSSVSIGATVPAGAPSFSLAIAGRYYGDGAGLTNLPQPSFPRAYLSWDPGPVANAACASSVVTLQNAIVGDLLIYGFPVLPTGFFGVMFVSTINTVTIRICNLSGGTVSPGSLGYSVMLVK